MRKKPIQWVLGTFFVYAVLVATNLGEFWPFSIYPMFSQAGKPWSRAVVRDVSQAPDRVLWNETDLNTLPGTAVALAEYGIAAEGIANFVSKTKTWDRQRVNGLQKLFTSSRLGDRDLLVMKAEGYLTDDNDVSIRFIPYVWLRADSVQLNPALIEQEKP